jgi:tetratricopeptide (TPR) repeat protein
VAGEPFENLAACGALLERLGHPAEALEFRRARVQAAPWDAAGHVALARTEIAAAQDRPDAQDRLGRIAESSGQPYSIRVEAARAFSAAGGRLGRPAQSELDWLRSTADLTPAAVDRPMFVAARLAAAERAAEASVRVTLLREAVAADPAAMGSRVPLFRAELAAGKPADAIEAIQPILRRSGRSLANSGLTAADRARLARELGSAHWQVDRLPEALRFFTIALEGQTAAARAPIRQQMTTLGDEIARRARTAIRQPRVNEALDQPQLVRPRIPPRDAVPGGPR